MGQAGSLRRIVNPPAVLWSPEISKEADASLRSYLALHGLADRDLSRFVEEAVRWRILDKTVAETEAANAGIPAEEIEATIDEVLQLSGPSEFANRAMRHSRRPVDRTAKITWLKLVVASHADGPNERRQRIRPPVQLRRNLK